MDTWYSNYREMDLPRTVSGMSTYYSPPYNPMEDAYRIALRSLEDSFEREIMTINRFYPMDYSQRGDYYHMESEARYRYDKAKGRLYDDFRNASQRYMYQMANQGYGYGLRQNRWAFPSTDYANQMIPYQYTYTYLNPKETTPVPTETKKYIILDSDDEPTTYYGEATDNSPFPPFTTLAEAEKEAQELTRKNPDTEYTIYQTVKKYKVAGTPLDTVVFV